MGEKSHFLHRPGRRGRKDGAEGYRLPIMDIVASLMPKDQGIFGDARQIEALAGCPRPLWGTSETTCRTGPYRLRYEGMSWSGFDMTILSVNGSLT
ncbi:hypothetical protein GCM10023157_08970 [Gluconacetobacter asukensis]